jgi:hypothetical protein
LQLKVWAGSTWVCTPKIISCFSGLQLSFYRPLSYTFLGLNWLNSGKHSVCTGKFVHTSTYVHSESFNASINKSNNLMAGFGGIPLLKIVLGNYLCSTSWNNKTSLC